MKKGLLGLLVIVVLGYAGTTFYLAGQAETQFKKSVLAFNLVMQQEMKDSPGPKFDLALVGYSKGLINSDAKLKLTIDTEGMPVPVPLPQSSFELPITIHHGPFIFSKGKFATAYATASASFPDKMAQKQLQPGSTLPSLNLSLLINLDGSANVDVSVPDFKLEPKMMPAKFESKGMSAQYNISKDMQRIHGVTTFDGVTLESPMANAQIDPIEMNYDVSATKYGLWVGSGDFKVPAIDVSIQGRQMFKLDDLNLTSSADITSGLLKLMLTSSMKQAIVKGKSYGPFNLRFVMKNFDAKTFVEVQNILQTLNQAKYLPKKHAQKAMNDLQQKVPVLLGRGAEVDLKDFQLTLPQGEIEADFNAKIAKGAKITNVMDIPKQVVVQGNMKMPKNILEDMLVKQAAKKIRHKQMLMQLQGNGHQVAPSGDDATSTGSTTPSKPMLSRSEIKQKAKEQVDNQIKKLLDAQVLLQKDSAYLIKFKFDKGKMSVNDKPVTPDMLEQ